MFLLLVYPYIFLCLPLLYLIICISVHRGDFTYGYPWETWHWSSLTVCSYPNMAVPDIRLVFWNIQGLNGKFKRSLFFKLLASHKPQILFLQKTHLTGSRILALCRSWVRQAFHATFSTYVRGVAILIKKKHCPVEWRGWYWDPVAGT